MIFEVIFSLALCFRSTEPTMVTKPSDAIVFSEMAAMFYCSVKGNYTTSWRYTPIGSNESFHICSSDRSVSVEELYRSGFGIDDTDGNYDLIVYGSTYRYAGKYECVATDGYKSITASAELGVIGSVPKCEFVNFLESIEITCSALLAGNVKPTLSCWDGRCKSLRASFYEHEAGANYRSVSLKTTFPKSLTDTEITCAVLRSEDSYSLYKAKLLLLAVKPASKSVWIIISAVSGTVFLILIVGCVVYKCRTNARKFRNPSVLIIYRV